MKKLILLCAFLPTLIQSLSVSHHLSDTLNNIFINHREFGVTPAPPPHDEHAKLARYVVHYSGKVQNYLDSKLQWLWIENQQNPIYVVNCHFSRHSVRC